MVSALRQERYPRIVNSRRPRAAVAVSLPVAVGASLLLARGPLIILGVVVVLGIAAALVSNVEIAVLAFVAVTPFEGYVKSISGTAVKALGGVLFVAWLYRLATRRNRVHLEHPVIGATGVLLAALMGSTVLHQNGPLGTEVLVRYLSYAFTLVVLVDCMQDRLPPRRVAQVYVAAASAAAVVGLVAFFHNSLRAGGPIDDPNDFAFFLLAALALCLGLRHDRHHRLYDLAALALVLGILATLSRGALLGVAGMLVFAVATHRIKLRVLITTATLVGIAALCVLVLLPTKFSTSLHAKGLVAHQNIEERLVRWKVASEMTVDYPVLGLGPAGFRENFDRYIDYQQTDVAHQLDVAHDTYLEVSSELGLIGLAAFLGVLGFGLRGAWRTARRHGSDAGLAGFVCAGLIGTTVAAIFLTEQYYLPLWLLAALGASLEARGTTAEAR